MVIEMIALIQKAPRQKRWLSGWPVRAVTLVAAAWLLRLPVIAFD